MKKVTVDADVCIGCGLCVGNYPEIFAFNDDGKAEAVAEGDDAACDEAIASCPVQAIAE